MSSPTSRFRLRTTAIDIHQPYKAIYYITLLVYNLAMIALIWSVGITKEHVFPQPEFAVPYMHYATWFVDRSPPLALLIPFYMAGFAVLAIVSGFLPSTKTVLKESDVQRYH